MKLKLISKKKYLFDKKMFLLKAKGRFLKKRFNRYRHRLQIFDLKYRKQITKINLKKKLKKQQLKKNKLLKFIKKPVKKFIKFLFIKNKNFINFFTVLNKKLFYMNNILNKKYLNFIFAANYNKFIFFKKVELILFNNLYFFKIFSIFSFLFKLNFFFKKNLIKKYEFFYYYKNFYIFEELLDDLNEFNIIFKNNKFNFIYIYKIIFEKILLIEVYLKQFFFILIKIKKNCFKYTSINKIFSKIIL